MSARASHRPPLARAGVALLCLVALAACEPDTRDLDFTLILPEDATDYETADNASLLLSPDEASAVWEVDGLDFTLEVQVEPSTRPRTLSVFLARGESLLAWGRSAPFITAGANVGIGIFLGRPGRLSTFPGRIETPDPRTLSCAVVGRGMLSLASDGTTALLSEYDYRIQVGTSLDDPPDPDDGELLPDPIGGALRLAFEQTPGWVAVRFDPAADRWSRATVAAAPAPRPGAAHLVEPGTGALWVIGGGSATDSLVVDTVPDAEGELALQAAPIPDLDHARPNAAATWLPVDEGDPPALLLFGGGSADDGPGALAWSSLTAEPFGPPGLWTGAACGRLDGRGGGRLLCVGGLRDGLPTADGALIVLGDSPRLELLPDLLPVPMADPILLEDPGALYAQGEGRLLRVARDGTLTSPDDLREVEAPSTRANGGRSVSLPTGATFLAGGWDVDGTPIDRWEVFLPEPTSTPPR